MYWLVKWTIFHVEHVTVNVKNLIIHHQNLIMVYIIFIHKTDE
jgi:hypothetical protein